MLRHHKTRFLCENPDGFWVESAAGEHQLIDALIQTAQPAGISFRGGVNRVAFTAPILRREPNYSINESIIVEALLFAFPADIKSVQRRNFYRVRVTPESALKIRVWRLPERVHIKDRPPAAMEIAAQARNLSAGGIGLTLTPKENELKHLSAGDRLRLQISYGESSLLIEGRIRYKPANTLQAFNVGVQFAKLEGNLEGRQTLATLTKIVGEMQREEVRRQRLGIAG